jgi:predicted fused transcriptional regulator/phosphomethylpyrimidine kinase
VETPISLITDIFLPNIRALEAKKLRSMDMSQSKIASLLGVTQPAVKQYLDTRDSIYLNKLKELGMTENEINEFLSNLTEILLKNEIKNVMFFITIYSMDMLSRLRFCPYHRKINPLIPQDCNICEKLYKEDEEEQISLAASMLQNEIISPLIPEVLSNIAFARKNPREINDVIAIAGRITKIRGIPTPVSKPMWGASNHLAKILIAINSNYPEIRSVMNIKYDENVKKSIQKLGYRFTLAGPKDYANDDILAKDIANAFNGVDVVIHLGGKGVEPITYVFGKNPLEVVRKVIEISRKYKEIIELSSVS